MLSLFKQAFQNLFRRKKRTFLSLLSIIIGVASIMVLVSFVDGSFADAQDLLADFSGIDVWEKGAIDQIFSQVDESFVAKLESVQEARVVTPEIWTLPSELEGKKIQQDFSSSTVLYGVDTVKNLDRDNSYGIEVAKGRDLRGNETGSVVVGPGIIEDYKKLLNDRLEINDRKFKIVGIFDGGNEFVENFILMNIDDVRDITNFPDGKVSIIHIDLKEVGNEDKVREKLEFKFGDDVDIYASSDYSDLFESTIGSFRLVVLLISAIAAVVAGVGIINTMLMSVFERYKEIGALKAVGWRNWDIMLLVILESLAIGIVGGILGLIVGTGIILIVQAAFGLTALITLELLLEAFSFALIAGIIAGLYPAYIASNMDPVDALRYE